MEMLTFPSNPALSLLIADLAIQLQHIPNNSFMGIAIKEGAKENPRKCIKMVQDQIRDAGQEMADVIGWRLVDKIKNIEV